MQGRRLRYRHDLATAAWTGAPDPTPEDVIDWFMGCFPIRSDAVRAELRRSLEAALEPVRIR